MKDKKEASRFLKVVEKVSRRAIEIQGPCLAYYYQPQMPKQLLKKLNK